MDLRSAEAFTGCGGLALGMSRAGFIHSALVEFNSEAVATVRHNIEAGVAHVREWPIQQADVRDVDWTVFRGKLMVTAGGPPCQPFSIGGKAKGHDDHRDMWPQAVRMVRESRPPFFAYENVRGLTRKAFAGYLDWIKESLGHPDNPRAAGESHLDHLIRLRLHAGPPTYVVRDTLVDAADYGAPQQRWRVIIAGAAVATGITPVFPAATHSRARLLWEQWVTGAYWKRHGLPQPGDEAIIEKDAALVRQLRGIKRPPPDKPWVTVRDAIADLGEPDGNGGHALQPGARSYAGHTGSILDMPAKALKAGDHGVPGGENMIRHADGSVRYFTVREAARLVGLPDSYEFPRSWTESMRQLGNAVPAQLGEVVGRWLAAMIDDARARKTI